ncbi:MAG: nuclear transport factor 2 family protein [Pseudomonadales bacterium]|nr:nuclear transport factor 2 family protein [Pseudomonadales bacterium]
MDLTRAEFANEAFYLAFESKDFAAMDHLWSESREVICIHPGWPALIGRAAVMQSWKSILGNPAQGAVSFYDAEARPLGTGVCAVVCYELAGNATLIATNVFVEENERLRLVLHQSGYCSNPPPPPR